MLIDVDGMDYVFDYDPLIFEIDRIAKEVHYETQERLITRILSPCATYDAIQAIEINLSKRPVLRNSGELGIRLNLEAGDLARLQEKIDV